MTATFEGHVHWYEEPRQLHLSWTRVNEPVAWITETTDAFLRSLGSAWGIPRWEFPEGNEWIGSDSELGQLVESRVRRNSDGTVATAAGYFLFLSGPGHPIGAEVLITAGSAALGSRLPLHRLTVHPRPLRGEEMSTATVDELCDLAVRLWKPASAVFTSVDALNLWKNTEERRHGWVVDPGYRLWLSNEVATIDYLADGVTATRLHGGTMLAVPDDWSPEQVVETVGETLERNGITEIPH